MTGQTISHYEILDELGSGGMGVVYKARDTKLDRIVALKFLPKKLADDDISRQRFMIEARAAAKLTHANICTVYEIDEHDGQMFMAMECIDGTTLKDILADGALSVDRSVSFAVQIAKGLQRAHDGGITHRDIKPANIMITDHDEVKILDFGLAKLTGGVDITKSGSTLGTAAYMSPEQARGEEIDQRTDLWALGATFYEMLSGSRPFAGDYEAAVGYAILNEKPAELPAEIPDTLSNIIDRCLAKNADSRYQSASELLSALAPLAPILASSSNQTVIVRSQTKWRAPVIGGALIVLAALIWIFARPTSTTESATPTSAIVVFPFNVQGDSGLDILRDGLVSTISRRMDGIGSIKTVDPNRILARVNSDPNTFFDPDESGLIAAGLSADRFIIGSVVSTGSRTELIANIYDLDGIEIGDAQSDFETDDGLPEAIDELVVQLIRAQLEGEDASRAELVTPTTRSFEALKFLLEAESSLRQGHPDTAIELAERAISHDSTLGTAWYIRARAYSWTTGNSGRYFRQVEPYKESLPPRLRRLYRLSDFYRGTGEQMIRAFLREYPDDIQGIGRLADNIFHSGPRRYQSTSESIPIFQQVIDLDPDNGEGLIHMYTQLIRDRRIEAADTLRLKYQPDEQFAERLIGFAANDSAVIANTISEIREGGGTLNLGFMLAASERWAAVEIFYDATGRTDSRFYGLGKQAQGKVAETNHFFDDVVYRGWFTPFNHAAALLAPQVPVNPEKLLYVESRLFAWLEQPDSMQAVFAERSLLESDDLEDAILYMSAQIHLRLGNSSIVEERYDRLNQHAVELGDKSLAYHLVRRLDGLRYYESGEMELSLEVLTEGLDFYIGTGVYLMPLSHDAVARSTRAEVLASLGRYDEAIATYRSLNDGMDVVDAAWIGPSYIRRAEWSEELGDVASAIESYRRFIELWSEADAHLQPKVEAARVRLDKLVLQQTQEPR